MQSRTLAATVLAAASAALTAWAAPPPAAHPAAPASPAAPSTTGAQPLLPPVSELGMARMEKMRQPKKPPKPHKLVDINHASARELKTLPGITDAEAARIIAGRPYWSKAQLVSKNVLPAGPYQSLRKHIVASQQGIARPKPAAAPVPGAARP